MKHEKTDRRSQRTRDLLDQAIFALMAEKRYESITVQDIIDRANVGRATFYAHFQDKEDLAISSLERMLDGMAQQIDAQDSDERWLPLRELLQHIQEQQVIFQGLVRGRGLDVFVERSQFYFARSIEKRLQTQLPKGSKPAIPLALTANYMAGAVVALLKWWLDNKLPYSPVKMDEMCQQLLQANAAAALARRQR